jgi:hypothetical protein
VRRASITLEGASTYGFGFFFYKLSAARADEVSSSESLKCDSREKLEAKQKTVLARKKLAN